MCFEKELKVWWVRMGRGSGRTWEEKEYYHNIFKFSIYHNICNAIDDVGGWCLCCIHTLSYLGKCKRFSYDKSINEIMSKA